VFRLRLPRAARADWAWLLRHGQQYVAVPAAGQQAIFQYAGISQSMNEEQTPDEQQQYDHDTNKVSGLTFGGLAVQFVI
jgi:hypothetical protein